jgi:hypothetical protein
MYLKATNFLLAYLSNINFFCFFVNLPTLNYILSDFHSSLSIKKFIDIPKRNYTARVTNFILYTFKAVIILF